MSLVAKTFSYLRNCTLHLSVALLLLDANLEHWVLPIAVAECQDIGKAALKTHIY